MAADYLMASLQPLSLDAPAPYTEAQFATLCREQLGEKPFARLEPHWNDLATQIRNAIAAERARLRNEDPTHWRRPAQGCSLFWANRVAAAFQETDPARRERLLDQVWWDAAGELVPPAAPLSTPAAYAYALRLDIVRRRQAAAPEAGRAVFDRLTAAARPTL